MKTRLMFDYARNILENVSFDAKLFYKELQKAIKHLLPYDVERLTEWVSDFVQGKPELHDSLNLINS